MKVLWKNWANFKPKSPLIQEQHGRRERRQKNDQIWEILGGASASTSAVTAKALGARQPENG